MITHIPQDAPKFCEHLRVLGEITPAKLGGQPAMVPVSGWESSRLQNLVGSTVQVKLSGVY